MAQLCSQLENVLSKIRPRVDMLWIITCSGRITSFFSRFDRYVRYKPLRPPEKVQKTGVNLSLAGVNRRMRTS